MNAGWLTVTYGKTVQSFSLSNPSMAAITMRFNYIVLWREKMDHFVHFEKCILQGHIFVQTKCLGRTTGKLRGRVHSIVNCMEFFRTLQCYEGMQIENRGISQLLVRVWVGTKLVPSWHSHCTNNYFINIISSGDMRFENNLNKRQKLKLLEK